jgi:hypothetical protein
MLRRIGHDVLPTTTHQASSSSISQPTRGRGILAIQGSRRPGGEQQAQSSGTQIIVAGNSSSIRPPRLAKTRANEVIVSHLEESDDECSEVESSSSDEENIEKCTLSPEEDAEMPEDDELGEEVVYWGSDTSSDEEPDLPTFPKPIEISPDGREWRSGLPKNGVGRQRKENVFHGNPGAIKRGIQPQSEMDAFLIFTDDLIDNAVVFTNLQGRRSARASNCTKRGKTTWKKTDKVEMEAFFGLLLIAGAYKAQYRSVDELWSQKEGHPVFRATMTKARFCALKGHLRFDDPIRRDANDPLAPIRNVATSFITKLRDYVFAPECLCVDEQLLEFHGRVRFLQYIPSKPGKFGIKIFWLTDAAGTYCFNGLFYIGAATLSTDERSKSSSFAEAVVMNLMSPFLNNGRHLTADNWFSSINLTERLLENKTTYVGTIRRNQRGLPPTLKSTVGRKRGDTKFMHNDKTLLISFWDKGTAPVLLVDSLHRGNEDADGKPSTVLFYNETKSGVDIIDRKIRSFSCKRKCRRWPFGVACNLLDIACINAMYLMKATGTPQGKTYHYEFIKNTGYQLVENHIRRRMQSKTIKASVRAAIKMVGFSFEESCPVGIPLAKPRRCQLCPHSKDQKTKNLCCKCSRAICGSHRALICHDCVE